MELQFSFAMCASPVWLFIVSSDGKRMRVSPLPQLLAVFDFYAEAFSMSLKNFLITNEKGSLKKGEQSQVYTLSAFKIFRKNAE